MSTDIFSSWELTAQQSDLLREMGLTQDQIRTLEAATTQTAGSDGGDQVEFSPEALAMALQYVQKSEESPSADLSANQENSGSVEDGSGAGAAVSAPTAMAGGGGAGGASSSSSDQIDELEEEIEELEQEILELRAKTDEESKTELKVKETELAMKQAELAQLESNQA